MMTTSPTFKSRFVTMHRPYWSSCFSSRQLAICGIFGLGSWLNSTFAANSSFNSPCSPTSLSNCRQSCSRLSTKCIRFSGYGFSRANRMLSSAAWYSLSAKQTADRLPYASARAAELASAKAMLLL
uniref:(northern house mosquito) hypothetical protein n=1 Tax=Culex pipiens TaxID=7175 RepID=A0A8D8E484_CULPI